MRLGTAEIYAFPLGGTGDRLRGFRANCLCLDEVGYIGKSVIDQVLRPMLSTNFDPRNRERVVRAEEELVKAQLLKPEDMTRFANNKFIGCSSATYQFEYLYEMYQVFEKILWRIKVLTA